MHSTSGMSGRRSAADVLGRGVLEHAGDAGGPVEPGDDGHAARDGGRLESTDLLHPQRSS
jgi:hypothetical protein